MIETYRTYQIIYQQNDDDIVGLATDLKIIYDDNGIVNEVQEKLDELKKTYKQNYLVVERMFPENE
tara:strand:- start:328 stop:525 length:198 start_codon:yes stop_codon:yes gene_type:complete